MTATALEVTDLTVTTTNGTELVAGVNVAVNAGELMGLVGETGAGKTITARAMLGLLPAGLRATGRVRFGSGHWISADKPGEIAEFLGRTAGLMLQNPAGAFDPVQRVGPQLVEAVVRNGLLTKPEAIERARMLCQRLGLGEADTIFRLYPHQLSGGMSQRAALALTLMSGPQVLVVDEPTSALDANLRVDALKLLRSLATDSGMAIVLISHDLGLVSRFCDGTVVLYAGHLAEVGPTEKLLSAPAHPYTRTLISCSLRLDQQRRTVLPTVGGDPPSPGSWPSGCFFHTRCPDAQDRCVAERPEFVTADDRGAACHFAQLEVRS